jgi:nucleoside-diphosphate-sugar epimerase
MGDGTAGAEGLFCFGLGYCAQSLAASLKRRGCKVAGTARTPEAVSEVENSDTEVFCFDGKSPVGNMAAILTRISHLLVSIPPDGDEDPVLTHHRDHIAGCVGDGTLRWIGYLSTTGVYGDRQGAWVDETTPRSPTSDRARFRSHAEQAWLSLAEDAHAPVHVFRLAGIYGPGRNQLAAVRVGKAHRVQKPGQVFSRIHVDDVTGVLTASMARPRPGAVYNVCDDDPAPPEDVVTFAAQLAGVTPPPVIPFSDADLSAMARSFYADNKRVSNDLIKKELGYALKYPTYRDGLQAIAETL